MKKIAPLAFGLALTVGGLAACSSIEPDASGAGEQGTGTQAEGKQGGGEESPPPVKELPQGGVSLFPEYRLVGYSGIKGSGPGLGRAGVGNLDERMTEIVQRTQPYAADGHKVMPVLEVIATMVHPCSDAPKCRTRMSDEQIKEHLDAVRKVDGVLLLAIQPGRSDFPTEVKAYEKWLKEPDVGVALDPEWRMGPDQEPGTTFGSTDGSELNETAAYLHDVVQQNKLPEKVFLYHMIRTNWVRDPQELKPHAGVEQIVSVDGIGSKKMKLETWNAIMKVKPYQVRPGFKLFYEEDTARPGWELMTPQEVMALTPRPDYVLYE